MDRIPGFPSMALCQVEETVVGVLVNRDTGRPLSENDSCVGRGLIAGFDPAANAAARAAVKALLIERFSLKP
jgi:hypothetical protein